MQSNLCPISSTMYHSEHKQTNSDTETACALELEPNGCSPKQFEIYSVSTSQIDSRGPILLRLLPKIRALVYPSTGSSNPNGGPTQAPHQPSRPRTPPDRTRGGRTLAMNLELPPLLDRRGTGTTPAAATTPIRARRAAPSHIGEEEQGGAYGYSAKARWTT